ncbi:YveK family protein [Ureibacillus thermosphaericus]|uniref:YveK family protein n=1 Tax=Ureibacillus thermosphaericus TaxID=51173 RepID=UPI000BBBA3CB|nr:Wzz/FepE/Etk N-terminal domain-containing protein [Ureibacillus thermosphaericus]
MEETISLYDIFKVLRKRIVLILSIAIVATLTAAIISFYILTPIYQASTQILVNQKPNEHQNQIQSQDIQANLQLINTYNVIIKSPVILNKVIEILDLNTTPVVLSNQITVSNANNSQVVNISVQDEQAYLAVDIANTVAKVFEEEIKQLMNVDNVNILSPAELPENPSPVKPNKMLNMAIALVIGLMIGVGLAFLLEYLDTTIKTEKDVEELLNLPIIGFISKIPDSNREVPTTVKSKQTVRREKVNV